MGTALTNAKDQWHDSVLRYMQTAKARITTSVWVLVELANFFTTVGRRAMFLATVEKLEADSAVTIISALDADYRAGLNLFSQRPDKEWSLTDCISMVILDRQKISDVLTSDKHFEQAGYQILLK